MWFTRKCYFVLMRGQRVWRQATKKYIGGYRIRLRGNGIVITIICITIAFLLRFILYTACTLWYSWGGWWTTSRRRIWWPPFLALILFDLGLALEVLQFATLLVVLVVHPAILAATCKFSWKLRWCLEVLVSNKFMFEDVTLHMLLSVFPFLFRLLLRDVRHRRVLPVLNYLINMVI